MLPEHRLAVLLEQVKESQVNNCLYHTSASSPSLYSDHICDRNQFPSDVLCELDKHSSEVWQICFSHDGTRLASSGADRAAYIWDLSIFDLIHRLDGHADGIGNMAWSPDDTMMITCGRDRLARIWNTKVGLLRHARLPVRDCTDCLATQSGACIRLLERFSEPVSSCIWAADSQSFILGSFDKEKALCQWNLEGDRLYTWTKKHRTEDLTASPDGHWMVAMDDQNHIHVYSFLTRELEWEMDMKTRPTSVSVSRDSRFLLVNKIDGEAQLIDIATREPIQKYSGATGGEFVIRSSFAGANESYVVSGSEGTWADTERIAGRGWRVLTDSFITDGSICIWHKVTGILIQRFLDAHKPRCNAVRWSPTDPCLFASCGDDNKIKM